jgi:hypothetical protein
MEVTNPHTTSYPTPLGTAWVWHEDNPAPRCMVGWHFMLADENKHYFSEHGRSFLRLCLHEPFWLPDAEETDCTKVKMLRELWKKAIERDFAQRNPF